ncbi:hypothetical protein ACFQI3_08665 [Hansschlegelia quercus]|uniref:Lipoprotein n=1 Tax=Hansschlegelia quercus TaxID=2528245 RepID=A0A4V2JE74_9HYPH|nr:hypothetical protein [Hansschlegelia quercus]TBN54166.1 hypothetical protein EYR15_04750 [Hansschlegelia quercus]
MRASGVFVRFALVTAGALALALAGCGKYGPKGDRGLPPPPTGLSTPRVYPDPGSDPNRPLKSQAEQRQLQADLLARKRQPRAAR